MIMGIKAIGEAIIKDMEDPQLYLVELLVDDLPKPRGEKGYVLVLKINSDEPSLSLGIGAEFSDPSPEISLRFLWVGNPTGANDDQDRLTTNNVEYLISQTIPNLIREDRLREGELRYLLDKTFHAVFLDLEDDNNPLFKGQRRRYRYIWDLKRLGIERAHEPEELKKAVLQSRDRKRGVKEVAKVLKNEIKSQLGIKPDDILLYTLEIDGRLVVQHPDYRRYIFKRLVGDIFTDAEEGVCHICGERKRVTWNTKQFKLLKFYITDKIGFSSGLKGERGGFSHTYRICENCYIALLAGENFVRNKLKSSLAFSDVYVIPSFHMEVGLNRDNLEMWSEYLKGSLGKVSSMDEWRRFQREFENFSEMEKDKSCFMFNFLFASSQRAAVKISKLIQDVPPSRLDLLVEKEGEVSDLAEGFFGEGPWRLKLNQILYLFPARKGVQPIREMLEVYDALFTGKPLSAAFLRRNFIEVARMYHHESFGAYIHKPPDDSIDKALTRFLIQSQLFLKYLEGLRMLDDKRREKPMPDLFQDLEPDLKRYLEEMGYDGPRSSLFLLGYLVGQVGNAQASISRGENVKKPILNKINFMGMPLSKVMRLTNEIFEKLDQYRKLDRFTEVVFSIMKELMDECKEEWDLTPQDNVYYILS
ncbi:TPA: TIGR02556 family CRISPR-associated protein, partial [Candidatus Poribacteria bacterium]|nr:TIGR02556 family CRISPR-associated protein [Candidatus Poribacteria bacterium]